MAGSEGVRHPRTDAITAMLYDQLDTISAAVSALRCQVGLRSGSSWVQEHIASISAAVRTLEHTIDRDSGSTASMEPAPTGGHALLTTLQDLSHEQEQAKVQQLQGEEEYWQMNSLFEEDLSMLPEELTLVDPILHLVLCVHGIGMHKDFVEGQKEDDGGGSLMAHTHAGL